MVEDFLHISNGREAMDLKLTPKNRGAEVLMPHALCPIAHLKRKMVCVFFMPRLLKACKDIGIPKYPPHQNPKNI